jgi:hypothetical protein
MNLRTGADDLCGKAPLDAGLAREAISFIAESAHWGGDG